MKRNTGLLLVALLAALTLLVSGCGEKQETPDGAPDEPLMQEEDLIRWSSCSRTPTLRWNCRMEF